MAESIESFIKKISRFENRLKKIQDRRLSARNMKEFGERAVDQIKSRSRRGFGLTPDGSRQTRFKNLAKSTKDYRKRYSKNLDSNTSPNKSNITATGQMLDALKVSSRNSEFSIGFRSGRRKRELSGGPGRISNEEVAFWVEENGRKFLGLTRQEKNTLIKKVINEIDKDIEKEF